MSRSSTLILLGVLVILAPFSGLPITFRNLFAVIFGACVLGIGLSMRAREVRSAAAAIESPPTGVTLEPERPSEISPI